MTRRRMIAAGVVVVVVGGAAAGWLATREPEPPEPAQGAPRVVPAPTKGAVSPQVMAASQLLQKGDPLGARRLLQAEMSRDPGQPDVLFHLGVACQRLGLLDEAEQHLRNALATGPSPRTESLARACLGEVLVTRAQRGVSVDQAALDQGIAELRAAIAKQDEPFMHRILGSALAAKPDVAGAMAELAKAAERDASDVLARLGLARLALDADRPDVAEKAAREILAVGTSTAGASSAEAHHLLGRVAEARGDDERAAAEYQAAAAAAPSSAEDWYRLAAAQRRLGRDDGEARARFEQATVAASALEDARRDARSAPGSAVAQHNLGVTLARAGQLDEAMLAFQRAIALDPALAGSQPHQRGLIELAAKLAGAGRLDDARAQLERVLAADPRNVAALHDLGGVHLQAGRPLEAAAKFREVLAIDPSNASARHYLAIAEGTRR